MPLAGWPAVTDDSGTKMDGTPFDEALWDAAEAAIEAAIFGSEDPAQTPGETTDEVIQARGSMDTLDERLDVALNEDGTLKSPSGVPLLTEVQSLIASRNLLVNGDFEEWSGGAALAPDEWTLSGSGASVAQTGPGQVDTLSLNTGGDGYAAKITRAGTDCSLRQEIVAAADWTNHSRAVNRKVSALVIGISDELSQLRLGVTDGVSTTYSDYHSGAGTPEALAVVHTISGSATKLEVFVVVEGSNTPVYVGGPGAVFGDLEMLYWQPLTQESRSRYPVVFREQPRYRAGSSGANDVKARVSGSLYRNAVIVGNVGVGEDDLMSFDVPANVLDANAAGLEIEAWGAFAGNANNKVLTSYVGATGMATENLAFNGEDWRVSVRILRRSATALSVSWVVSIGTATTITATENYVHNQEVAFVAGSTLNLKFTGTATDNDDITQEGMIVKVL